MSRPRDACAPRRAEAGAPGVCRPPCLGGSSRVSAGRPASVRRLRQPGDGRGGSQASARWRLYPGCPCRDRGPLSHQKPQHV